MSTSNWNLNRDGSYAAALILLVLVAVLSPSDILSRFPVIRQFAGLVCSVFPFIEKYAAASIRPEVTSLALSLSMAFVPIVLPFFLRYQIRNLDVKRIRASRFLWSWGWTIFPFAFFPFALGGPDVSQARYYSLVDRLVITSRFALGIFSGAMMLLAVLLLAWIVLWPVAIFREMKNERTD